MVATLFLAGLTLAELSYCEPCSDETLDGIDWTSGKLANNYEYDGVTARNDDYKVLVKQSCAAGFTGTATRICDGNGAWKNPDLTGCTSKPCQSLPADFEDYLNIDNAAVKTNCPIGSAGGFECDVVCTKGYHPVSPTMKCYGGQWNTKGISCQPEPQDVASETTEGPAVAPGSPEITKTEETDDSVTSSEKSSSSAPIGIIVAVGVALAVLLVAGYVLHSSKSKSSVEGVNSSTSSNGSSRSHRKHHSSGSRRGKSLE